MERKWSRRTVTFFSILALILSFALVACTPGQLPSATPTPTGEPTAAPLKEVNLIYYMLVGSSYPDEDIVFYKVSEYVKSKINATVEIRAVDFGNYQAKLQLADASGEAYDICFTSSWLNIYLPNVNKSAYLPLDDLIASYGKDMIDISSAFYDAVRVNGKIYGVPNMQIVARAPFFNAPKELADKYNLDISKVEKAEDFEPYMKAVIQDSPLTDNNLMNWLEYAQIMGYEDLLGGNSIAAVNYLDTGSPKVINIYETEEFKHYIAMKHRWWQEGLINKVAIPPEEGGAFKDGAGNYLIACSLGSTYKPSVVAEFELYQKVTPVIKIAQKGLVSTSALTATMNAISANSPNPERAMMFLNLINSDKDLYNMLVFGIEGVHYNKIGENRVKQVEPVNYMGIDWAIGDVFNGYVYGNMTDDVWDQTKKLNSEGIVSPVIGFNADLTSVGVEATNCASVVNEFLANFQNGTVDIDATYQQMLDKLKASGSEKLITEIQRQLDAFMATKK